VMNDWIDATSRCRSSPSLPGAYCKIDCVTLDAIIVLLRVGRVTGNAWLRYRFPIAWNDNGNENVNSIDEIRRFADGLDPASRPASCGRDGDLRAVDDRRTRPSWLPPQPRQPLSNAACYRALGLLPCLPGRAAGPYREKALPAHQARQRRACTGKGTHSRIYRRGHEAVTLPVMH